VETPTILTAAYVSDTTTGGNFGQDWTPNAVRTARKVRVSPFDGNADTFHNLAHTAPNFLERIEDELEGENDMDNERRVVQVFIIDPDENVPLDVCLLYKGESKLTDMSNSELFFEVDINTILKTHNEKRVKMLDKKAQKNTGKDIYLEATRIRDLRMTVVDIASFWTP